MDRILRASLWLAALAALAAASSASAVEFSDGWVRAGPPGATAHAGYGTLTNDDDRPLHVRACPSSSFARAEIHRTELVDGVARMRPVDELVIAPGDSVTLGPEGTHLMLMEATGPVTPGKVVMVCIASRDFKLDLRVPVRDPRPGNADSHADDHPHH